MARFVSLLGAIALAGTIALPASASEHTDSAFQQEGFSCTIDLVGAGIDLLAAGVTICQEGDVPCSQPGADPNKCVDCLASNGIIRTSDTLAKCPGNTSVSEGDSRTTIDCEALVPGGWTGSAQSKKNVPCGYPRALCDLPDYATSAGTVQVSADGVASLTCECDPDQPNTDCVTGPPPDPDDPFGG